MQKGTIVIIIHNGQVFSYHDGDIKHLPAATEISARALTTNFGGTELTARWDGYSEAGQRASDLQAGLADAVVPDDFSEISAALKAASSGQ